MTFGMSSSELTLTLKWLKPESPESIADVDREGREFAESTLREFSGRIQFAMLLLILSCFPLLLRGVIAGTDEICYDGDCYPRIFVPAEEFQAVKEGQEIPVGICPTTISNEGLHIRINMQAFPMVKFLTVDWRERSKTL